MTKNQKTEEIYPVLLGYVSCLAGGAVDLPYWAVIRITTDPDEDGSVLSICGGTIPQGGWGQTASNLLEPDFITRLAKGWTAEMIDTFARLWQAYHLNDMRPYCPHQKILGWDTKLIDPTQPVTWDNQARWRFYESNKRGVLERPCPICGYKYGTEWRYEPVPEEVLEWFRNLPAPKCPIPRKLLGMEQYQRAF